MGLIRQNLNEKICFVMGPPIVKLKSGARVLDTRNNYNSQDEMRRLHKCVT